MQSFLKNSSLKTLLLLLWCLLFLHTENVSAHGYMVYPKIRINPGDYANIDDDAQWQLTNGPTNQMPCAGIQRPDGPIPDGNTFTKNQTINVVWRIRAAHQGGSCFVELLKDGRKSTEPLTLIEFTDCATDVLHDFTGGVQLPEDSVCEECILRWRWQAGDSTTFISCADIKIVDPNAPPATNITLIVIKIKQRKVDLEDQNSRDHIIVIKNLF
ncbi:12602_t:CDS:2 [Ambispora gerdemannii]|uniref:12602_t:CDS:1 n=1 Tax=Ambispora gerdemannii TaxID=144530 RepID=A0A9N9GBA1_9GLOM|nr:12602_t:CDS:2 [Ambispora gerdemannii]